MAGSSETGKIYASFMEEIKWRLNEIDRRLVMVKTKQPDFDSVFDVELCYLQLRFVCELVALASLVAHHSYGLKNDLLQKWHADVIFNELEGINEHCFPWPVRMTRSSDGRLHIADQTKRVITRTKLKTIYGKCGNSLHRGALKHALKGKERIYDPNDIIVWARSIKSLLSEHSILLPKENRAILVNLYGGPNGEVAVIQLAADGPFLVQRADLQHPSPAKGRPPPPRGRR